MQRESKKIGVAFNGPPGIGKDTLVKMINDLVPGGVKVGTLANMIRADASMYYGIDNFFDNLKFPARFANYLLQGELDPAGVSLCRFAVNTTAGLGGFIDWGTGMGLPQHAADFGQTLGRWGVPPGPYIVWPVFGSSNPRDIGPSVAYWRLVPDSAAGSENFRGLISCRAGSDIACHPPEHRSLTASCTPVLSILG